MKYTKIPEDTFQKIQLNAGILVGSFAPATGVIGDIIGATSGGVQFTATPTYSDYGDDIDNAPKNTKELKKLDNWEVSMSGSFITVDSAVAKMLVGASDTSTVAETDITKITPRNDIDDSDFGDIWWIGDYSDVNTGDDAGFIAIHMMNSLSTGGFSIQTSDRAKGTFSFTFTGHYSIAAQDTVPFEIYVKAGESEYTVSYNANGGTGTMTDSNSPYESGSIVTVKSNEFTAPSTKSFDSWNTMADGSGTEYDPADTFTINRNTTLYAIWS